MAFHQFQNALVLAHDGEHAPLAANDLGARTHQLNLGGLASLAYRQSDKFNFGHARSLDYSRVPRLWECSAIIEPASAPSGTSQVFAYLGFSDSEAPGVGNPGGLSGVDGAWTGYGAAASDANECITQLLSLGSVTIAADATPQLVHFNLFVPRAQYGILVIHSELGVGLAADASEMSVRLKPILELP